MCVALFLQKWHMVIVFFCCWSRNIYSFQQTCQNASKKNVASIYTCYAMDILAYYAYEAMLDYILEYLLLLLNIYLTNSYS